MSSPAQRAGRPTLPVIQPIKHRTETQQAQNPAVTHRPGPRRTWRSQSSNSPGSLVNESADAETRGNRPWGQFPAVAVQVSCGLGYAWSAICTRGCYWQPMNGVRLANAAFHPTTVETGVKSTTLEKAAFLLSAALLLFLYGYGSRVFNWFPDAFLDRAIQQARYQFGAPHYVAPRVYEDHGIRRVEVGELAPGLTLLATHAKSTDWQAGLRLIDRDGRTLHRWLANPAELFAGVKAVRGASVRDRRGVHGSYLFPNGDVLLNLEYLGIARLDACGNVEWRLQNGAHHSIARADDGSFWVPITDSAAVPRSERYPGGYPGLDRAVNHDRLLRVSEDGRPLDTISVLDVLYRNNLVRYLTKARVVIPTDVMHVNDVEPLPGALADTYPLFEAGDLLVSLRASDLVFVVDPETELVKWYASDPFVQQHDPDFIGDGWIGVFNNNWDWTDRGEMLGGSHVVALQPHTDSLRTLFPTTASDPFYTPFLGKWQKLRNGNMLLTEGRPGRLVEIAPDGRTVWEWMNEPYDESSVVEVTEGTRYELTRRQVAAWPCGMSDSSDTEETPDE